jgi:hypothetical protein
MMSAERLDSFVTDVESLPQLNRRARDHDAGRRPAIVAAGRRLPVNARAVSLVTHLTYRVRP